MRGALIPLLFSLRVLADVSGCACDPARPESLKARECSLCAEAEKQPAEVNIFFLKDANPRKPNRWLVLPRAHGKMQHSLAEMSPTERTALWTAAIEKARSLFGEQWGLALNGDLTRTQCHAHLHIGKLLEEIETERVMVVDSPADIPAPADGAGLWVHPHGGKLHVHLGEQLTETVLLR